MRQANREPLLSDVIGMVVGIGLIAVAYGGQFNQIRYVPGDNRAEPWLDPALAPPDLLQEAA